MADTQAATVAADDKENPAALAAAVALREQVYRHVLSSDVLNSVKAHLRAKLYAELKGGNGSGTSRGGGGGGLAWHAQAQHALPPARSPTLHQHILNCLVCDYLLAQQHKYTLSVILSETGSGALPQLSHADILRLVGVLPDSKVHALLTAGSGSGGLPSGGAEGGAASAAGDPPRSRCLAEGMVAALGSLGSHISTHNAACQTSDAEASNGAGGAAGGCGVSSQQLAQRLQAIEAEYCRKSSQLEAAAAQSLEDRMAAYQRDCDARCAAQLQERLAAFRDAELAAVREQESGRHAQLLEAERQGLQQEHHQRLAKLRAQEEELLERSRRQHREQDLLREEHLRCMRADEERLHAWRAESEAKLAAAQAAARRQLEQAAQAERQADREHKEGEERLQARLAQVQQREDKLARQQAAAEAGLAQVEQLQRQLAGALREQGSLRQQLAVAHAAHQAEQAQLRQERDQLAAAAAAAATGPGLSPQDSARLQAAVRRLMERVEGLQGQVEACRQRERLWKSSAAEADKLLGKSAKGQDRALQHCEELRLALAAAVREVADFQEQAALAAAGVEGPLAASLQALSRDAQRWRDSADARVSAAMQEEERMRRGAVQLSQRALANRTAAAQGLQQLLASCVLGQQQAAEPDADSSAERSPAVPQVAVPTAAPPSGSRRQAVQQEQQHRQALLPLPQQQAVATQAHAQQQWWQQQEAAHAALVQAAAAGTASSLQQTDYAAAGAAAKPPSRTSSDILAAYRARQQRSSGGGGGSASAGMAAGTSRGTSLSPEASGEPEGVPAAAAEEERQDLDPPLEPALEQQAALQAAAEAPVAAAADSYYVSDFTSDDSGRF